MLLTLITEVNQPESKVLFVFEGVIHFSFHQRNQSTSLSVFSALFIHTNSDPAQQAALEWQHVHVFIHGYM